MLRILHGAVGTLAAPLSTTSSILVVDLGLDALIRSKLAPKDWAYLAIDDGRNVEIVKVYAHSELGIRIERAQDYSVGYLFTAGARVYHTLTAVEIADSIEPIPLILHMRDALSIVNNIIYYNFPNIETLGATKVSINSEDILLYRDEQAYGCCDGNNDPAPVPALPIYLTSRPYPIEAVECFTTSANARKGLSGLNTGDSIEVTTTLLGGSLVRVVGYVKYPDYIPHNPSFPDGFDYTRFDTIRPTASVASAQLVQVVGYKTYSTPPDTIEGTAEVVSGTLPTVVGYIEYDYIPESITGYAQLISGSLQ